MQTLLNTLYVTSPEAYLKLENDTVRIEIEREKRLQVPLHHLSGVVCFGHTMLSPALMHRLAQEGKSLVLLDEAGRFQARLEGPCSGNILLRQAQFTRAQDAAVCLQLAQAMIAGKIRNARQVLLRAARENPDSQERADLERAAADLAASLRALAAAQEVEQVRGIEGEAARQYFACMNLLIKPAMRTQFQFAGRNRRPPRDALNALLSFLYSMLMNDCRSALEAVGLDVQQGFLHAVRPGRAALALDLMEEFRAVLADRLALTLINRGQLKGTDFIQREGGAVSLEGDARRLVVTAYQERKQEMLQHPVLEQQTAIGLLPMLQARLLARAVRGEALDYVPFLWK
ncbi:type I-C CRISPR-associated endonuclease Cas1c [Massilia sp. W12]|uniref:type I-C CRISPR-associated endonuclease Cas1c n=1 Tax=Massilia sp. W12 TaxID=3126507 RepID=UPI0030D1D93A